MNNMEVKEGTVRELERTPFDRVFYIDGNYEFCHATGMEKYHAGEWWCEYVSPDGEYCYGR